MSKIPIVINLKKRTLTVGDISACIEFLESARVVHHRDCSRLDERTITAKLGCSVPYPNRLGIYPPDYLDEVISDLTPIINVNPRLFIDVNWRPKGYGHPFITLDFRSFYYDLKKIG